MRALVAGLLLVGGVTTLLLGHTSTALLRPLAGVALVIAAMVVVLGPWWLRVGRDLVAERQARIRAEERADMASSVHDSVLQTLALIQRRAAEPQQVIQLARAQERELRSWLFDGRAPGSLAADTTFAGGLRLIQSEVEAQHGVTVEVVTVGDCALDEDLQAMLAAAREATVNAAKWSGVQVISLYAEVEPAEVVPVRPRPRTRLRPHDCAGRSQGAVRVGAGQDAPPWRHREQSRAFQERAPRSRLTHARAGVGASPPPPPAPEPPPPPTPRMTARRRPQRPACSSSTITPCSARASGRSSAPRVEVIGEADDVEPAIAGIAELEPDVVLLDVHLPGGGGHAVVTALKATHPHVRFLALSASDAPEDVIAVIRAGARGYVTKTISGAELVDAVHRVAAGEAVFSPRLAGFVLDAFAALPGRRPGAARRSTPSSTS